MSTKIMIIDDTPDLLILYDAWLQRYGVEVHAFPDGDTAALSCIQELKPDLILFGNLCFGEDSEFTFLQTLRKQRETAKIPIIILSTNADSVRFHATFKQLGFVYLISKPFDFSDLFVLVDAALRGEAVEPRIDMLHMIDLA
jgi:two-component system, sensor histidine kinase and response regulator